MAYIPDFIDVKFIKKNEPKIRLGLYIIAGLLLLLGVIWITTRKPQMPADIKVTIDSLTNANNELIKRQDKMDSLIGIYQTQVDKIDVRLSNIKEKTTIIREYYHEVGQKADKYTPTQIDSFLKARYHY